MAKKNFPFSHYMWLGVIWAGTVLVCGFYLFHLVVQASIGIRVFLFFLMICGLIRLIGVYPQIFEAVYDRWPKAVVFASRLAVIVFGIAAGAKIIFLLC